MFSLNIQIFHVAAGGAVADSYAVYRVRLRCLGASAVREDTAILPANKH